MGRFLSVDPMGYEDSLNLYQAFNMNPVNFTDPFGLQSFYEIYNTLFRKYRNWELQVRNEYNYSGPFRVQWEQGKRGRPYVDITTSLGPMRLYNFELRKLHPYIDEQDLITCGGGLLQTIWGAVQIKMAAVIATTSGGSLSPLSVALIAMGADNMAAGSAKVLTGRHQNTLLNKGFQQGAKLISDDLEFQTDVANYGEFVINVAAGGLAYNQLSKPGQMLQGNISVQSNINITPENNVVPESLLKGESDTHTYLGVRNQEPVYTGVTNDPIKRASQHGDRFVLREITDNPLTRRQARAIEQVIIENNPQFENIINGIGNYRSWYDDAVT